MTSLDMLGRAGDLAAESAFCGTQRTYQWLRLSLVGDARQLQSTAEKTTLVGVVSNMEHPTA